MGSRLITRLFTRGFGIDDPKKPKHIKDVDNVGLNFIKSWEGFRAKPYKDTGGVATIGFGTTYYPNGKRVSMDDPPMTLAQAERILRKNLKNYIHAVDAFTRDDITQNEFNALASFCYNVGEKAFQRSTLLREINTNPKNYEAIGKQFKRWVYDEGKRIRGLVNRRNAEFELYKQA